MIILKKGEENKKDEKGVRFEDGVWLKRKA
jgi:hypothetical protein